MADPGREPARSFWTRVRIRALLPYAVVAAALIAAVAVFGRAIGHHIAAMEAWIQGLGPWGVVVFIGLFVVLTSLLVPDTLMGILGGALFGLAGGTLVVVVGNLTAASLQYLLARRLLRRRIDRLLAARPALQAIQRAVLGKEFRLQVLLRLTPLNRAVTSYVLGASGVRFGGFILACLALIPNLFVEVYFGQAGKHLAKLAGGERWAALVHDAVLLGGLLICIVVMVVISRIARKAVQKAVA